MAYEIIPTKFRVIYLGFFVQFHPRQPSFLQITSFVGYNPQHGGPIPYTPNYKISYLVYLVA